MQTSPPQRMWRVWPPRFTDDDLFMVNSAADSSRRMYAVSRNGTSHMQLDGSLPFTLDVSYTLNGRMCRSTD